MYRKKIKIKKNKAKNLRNRAKMINKMLKNSKKIQN